MNLHEKRRVNLFSRPTSHSRPCPPLGVWVEHFSSGGASAEGEEEGGGGDGGGHPSRNIQVHFPAGGEEEREGGEGYCGYTVERESLLDREGGS